MTGSTLDSRTSPPFTGQFSISKRIPASKTSYARVVVFHYIHQNMKYSSNTAAANSKDNRSKKLTLDNTEASFEAEDDGTLLTDRERAAVEKERIKTDPDKVNPFRTTFDPANAFDIDKFTIEDDIDSLNTSRALGQTAGSFDISLFPTENWKQRISNGDWVAIYLFNRIDSVRDNNQPNAAQIDAFASGAGASAIRGLADLTKNQNVNLVMLGNVDRVSKVIEKNEEDDKTEVRYKISGRDFGKVFEDTDIWYDPYVTQENIVDIALRTAGLEIIGNPSTQSNQVLDVFLGPGAKFAANKTEPLKQWRIPIELSELFDVNSFAIDDSEPLFYDILRNRIEDGLPGYKTRTMLSLDSNGNLWEMLRRSSNELVNEMFIEEVRDSKGVAIPTLVIRPRPTSSPFLDDAFGSDLEFKPLLNGKHKSLQELSEESFIEISPGEVYHEDLGKDDHSRFNMWWLTSNRKDDQYKSIQAFQNARGKIGNPLFMRESVQRYGLKRYENTFEFDMVTGQRKEVTGEIQLFKAFMAQVYDHTAWNHLYDSGTMETSGVLEAELGKVLIVKEDKGSKNPERMYYIEGYSHEWNFPNTWKTNFTLTKGQYKTKDFRIFIDLSVIDDGRYDRSSDSIYTAKTGARNKKR